jgi:hypothetical protein|tara:strand:+ start:259 stop:801 length:543 start_codon:yes stop_codon:yes gene_type:complete
MANTTFDGPVRSRNGFQSIGPGAVDANTLATNMTVANNAGRIMLMDPATTPTAITLPSIISTGGSNNAGPGRDPNNPNTIGTTFEILFTDEFTGTIQTANTADKFVGSIMIGVNDGAKKAFVPAAANNELNLNGEAGASVATTGGLVGSRIKFTAVAANLYMVEGLLIGSGTIATPFDTQ